ncbi:MAG TPA: HAD family hydrolase [Trichocoleus sp.]|jgi:HAD superfamily hydrolase (TIGR01484 family)
MAQPQALNLLSPQAIRLIATDMDGTLTRSGKFTSALLQALLDLKQAGIPVVIVTGRSAGWVSGIVSYLPVAGAIAENGGLFYAANDPEPKLLVSIAEMAIHRQKLAQLFYELQSEVPQIQESADNCFRITDWTFDVQGLSAAQLEQLSDRCHQQGWSFTYSTVQCHLKSMGQDKAPGLEWVLQHHFPTLNPRQILTVGDSPNDESLFDPDRFPHSVGVANIQHYLDRLAHQPTYITQAAEADGFCELACFLLENA